MLRKLNESKWFEEIYCLVLCLISILCWKFAGTYGLVIILCIAAISLLVFNDFKYMIPCIMSFIFSNNAGFDANVFPTTLVISGALFIVVLIVFVIKNGFHISKAKSCVGMALLSISCTLPILWHNVIPEEQEVLLFMYLAWFLYFLIYLLFASSLKQNAFRMLVPAMGYMAILLSFECGLKVLELHKLEPAKPILDFWYYLGWGLCNEAGILMLVGLPFVFVQLINADNASKVVVNLFKIGIICVGIVLTGSRGAFLFGSIELVFLALWTLLFSKKKKIVGLVSIPLIIISLILVQSIIGIPKLITDIKDVLFANKLDDNGRLEIWTRGTKMWMSSGLNMMFGSGMISEFYMASSFSGWKEIYMVYHSTLLETLVSTGLVGFVFLCIHFFEKYKQLLKFNIRILGIVGISYIVVDIYGMIDNTYGMYYYMIPLVMIMASMDNLKPIRKEVLV